MQEECHSGEGGGGRAKRWQSVTWGEGVNRKSDVTHPKMESNQFPFLQFSIFKSLKSFSKIKTFWPSKFLRSFLKPPTRCIGEVTSHQFPLGISSIIPVQTMFVNFFFSKSCHFLVTWGGRGVERTDDKVWHGGRGIKIDLLEWHTFCMAPKWIVRNLT